MVVVLPLVIDLLSHIRQAQEVAILWRLLYCDWGLPCSSYIISINRNQVFVPNTNYTHYGVGGVILVCVIRSLSQLQLMKQHSTAQHSKVWWVEESHRSQDRWEVFLTSSSTDNIVYMFMALPSTHTHKKGRRYCNIVAHHIHL